MRRVKFWETRIKRYGEMESPCLIPLEDLIKLVGWSLIRREKLQLEIQELIHFIQIAGKFIFLKVARITFHSSVS